MSPRRAARCLALAVALPWVAGCGPLPVPPAGTQAASPQVRDRSRFPPELAELKSAIDASELPYVRIVPVAAKRLPPWASKFGGRAYLPGQQPYPRDAHGRPLALQAQVNFAEMPALAGYPSHGLLQFFTSGGMDDEHVYGAIQYDGTPFDGDDYIASMQDQRYFRVLFHPEVITDPAALATPPAPPLDDLPPVRGEAAMKFERDSEPVLIDDYRFEKVFGKTGYEYFGRFGAREEQVGQAYVEYSRTWATAKVGGYASVVQQDPRHLQPDADWLVLLELQSDGYLERDGWEIMWGDAGVGLLLIRRADLEKADFSKVAFYWDNH